MTVYNTRRSESKHLFNHWKEKGLQIKIDPRAIYQINQSISFDIDLVKYYLVYVTRDIYSIHHWRGPSATVIERD